MVQAALLSLINSMPIKKWDHIVYLEYGAQIFLDRWMDREP